MSAPVAPPAEQPVTEPPTAEQSGPRAGRTVAGASLPALWRRYRVVVLVAVAILVVAVTVGVAQSRGAQGRLDPQSPDPDGGRALAVLLGDRGVRVDRVTDPAALASGLGPRDAVLVPIPGLLDDRTARALGAAGDGTIILVTPPRDRLAAVTGEIAPAAFEASDLREPGCDDAAAVAAGAVFIGGTTYESSSGTRCYADGDDAPMVVGSTRGGARLVVLGSAAMLTNTRLDEDGNAALGINLLGGDGSADRLRWLVPAPGSAGDEPTRSILPDWVLPALLQLLLVGVLIALWRGRRLGPPVVEPLPVVVRSAEAVEGRSRLYRRAQARDRAADALRSGALARIVPRLGIEPADGGQPSTAAVVSTVAARSGQAETFVHATLFGPPPADDAGLVALADSLDSIVRTTLDPEVPRQ
jgi:Domain of unknown function (DUF4350)